MSEWLKARRAAAGERFAAGGLPSSSEEAWRYSRIDEFDLDRFTGVAAGTSAEVSTPEVSLPAGAAAKGVEVVAVADLDEAPPELGACADSSADAFVHMHDANLEGATLIRVPAGVVLDEPIVVRHHPDGSGTASYPRLVVAAAPDSEVTVFERFVGAAEGARLVVPVTELLVGQAARVRYLCMQDHNDATWQIALVRARIGQDATLRSSAVALGGHYARLRSEAVLEGPGASSEAIAVYFANESEMLDFRTLQDHAAHHTTSDLLFKGAVEDEARSVYSGLVRLRPEAKRAVASQTNRNLVLSSGAGASSIPNLEIEADDVRCSHASAVGPIDTEQLYYLESRGVPPEVAERLIVFGFFEDVIERLPVGEMAERLRRAVAAKFEARR